MSKKEEFMNWFFPDHVQQIKSRQTEHRSSLSSQSIDESGNKGCNNVDYLSETSVSFEGVPTVRLEGDSAIQSSSLLSPSEESQEEAFDIEAELNKPVEKIVVK